MQFISKRQDEAEWRVERLQKCARIAAAILSLTSEQLDKLISAMEDQKGALIVYWTCSEINQQQRLAFKTAWAECSEYIVEHVMVSNV